ncbi:hypothetical protein Q4517_09745 [Tenacibaculum sp. 1_MG-2023]|uniref:hypothetical protein n=1 Tax=Tenacibaculum sp. 1_MG-2023 TaxID=3062653 RepID=UPI0026E2B597|nr:hypothetical protein [Tenacibaculum sp. 1_MG-2023]MDO6675828.1 hypothetical protein [Tenacibaculum sp. 1_MG-2023]
MKKSISNLGKTLNKVEQTIINGGNPGHCTKFDCYNPYTKKWSCVLSAEYCPY